MLGYLTYFVISYSVILYGHYLDDHQALVYSLRYV